MLGSKGKAPDQATESCLRTFPSASLLLLIWQGPNPAHLKPRRTPNLTLLILLVLGSALADVQVRNTGVAFVELLMSHGTDSVRTNLAGSVGVKTEIWEFKYHFCSILTPGEQTPPQRHTSKAGRELPRMTAVMLCYSSRTRSHYLCVLCGF